MRRDNWSNIWLKYLVLGECNLLVKKVNLWYLGLVKFRKVKNVYKFTMITIKNHKRLRYNKRA